MKNTFSTEKVIQLLEEWWDDDLTCSGEDCLIKGCDLCSNCFNRLKEKFSNASQSQSVNLANPALNSPQTTAHASDSNDSEIEDTNDSIKKELDKDYAKVVGSGK